MTLEQLAGIAILIALVFLALGYLIAHVRALKQRQLLQNKLAAFKEKDHLQTLQLQKQQESASLQQDKYQTLLARFHQTTTRLSEREGLFDKQLQQIEEHRRLMVQEFENLANKVFEDKQQRFGK